MSEFDLINQYFKSAAINRKDVVLGIGDDCALLSPPPGKLLAISTDTLISGVHFPHTTSAENIGYKSLAVNLSDLAAMGADPAWVSLAISLPDANDIWLAAFMRGFNQLASAYNVSLIGGDTTRGTLSVSVNIVGFVEAGSALRRSAAKAGHIICVTGTLGDAGAGLDIVLNQKTLTGDNEFLVDRLNRPQPRINAGQILSRYAVAAIDISDGLLSDLSHICEASQCGANIHLEKIPLSVQLINYYEATPDWQAIINAGDDYELCFCCAADEVEAIQQQMAEQHLQMTPIGEITEAAGINCLLHNKLQNFAINNGYNHFTDEKR